MNKNILSVLIYNDMESCLEKCKMSISNSDAFDEGKIEIKVVDNGSDSIYETYNQNKSALTGEYILFSKSSCYYGTSTIDKIVSFVESENLNTEALMMSPNEYSPDNSKTTAYLSNVNTGHYKADDNTKCIINLALESYIIKKHIADQITFDLNIYDDASDKFIIESFRHIESFYYSKDFKSYHLEPKDDNIPQFSKQFEEWWYNPALENFIIPMLENSQKSLERQYLLYLIYLKYVCNQGEKYRRKVAGDELVKFHSLVSKALGNIEDILIVRNNNNREIPKYLRCDFMKIKNPDTSFRVATDDSGELNYYVNDISLFNITEERFKITNLNCFDGQLIIDGHFSTKKFFEEGSELYLDFNGKRTLLEYSPMSATTSFFGEINANQYSTTAVVPLIDMSKVDKLKIIFKYEDYECVSPLEISHPTARMYDQWHINYWTFADKIIIRDENTNELTIKKRGLFDVLRKEIKVFSKMLKSNESKTVKKRLFKLRFLYWMTRPYYKNKQIWLYYDKLYKAGDNGEYLFKYASKQNDNIRHYYIITKGTPDHKRMVANNESVLEFQSFKERLMALHSTVIVSTHANVFGYVGFYRYERRFQTNLFNPMITCIRHGVTIQYEPASQKRTKDNRIMTFTTSKYESENILRPAYGYSENQVKLTGSPRFDGLIDDSQKKILLAPTWRKYLSIPNKRIGSKRDYNPWFKQTDYFKIYNKLINDTELNDYLKEKGFSMQFLLHPTFSAQIEDFDNKYNVEIFAATDDVSYEKILREANVMVTDFSGVQFDFAFMKKPILYYHPPEIPPHLEEDTFKYSDMGFGPIIKTHEDMVQNLIKTVEGGCVIEPYYENRVVDFLAYLDRNNSKRIYDELIKLVNNNKFRK